MERRTYLRTIGLAVPGLLLSGWAPVRALAQPVSLIIRDVAGEGAAALRAGVAFGLADVRRTAEVSQARLRTTWATGLHPVNSDGVQVVVADQDPPPSRALDTVTSIYTCPLEEWRPEAWSVAASPSGAAPLSREWHRSLTRGGAAALNQRFLQRTGQPMNAAAWRGWMAVRVAFEHARRRAAGEDDLLTLRIDGHKGELLRFGDDGHLVQPTYRLTQDGRVAVLPPRRLEFDA